MPVVQCISTDKIGHTNENLMPIAEIITIGTELLLGDVQDTNSGFIARKLKETGYDLYRLSTVGDNPGRITRILQEALVRSDILITTGGLGPTVDDPTREAVASLVNVPLIFHPELWVEIEKRFASRGMTPTENNRKQAMLPAGVIAIKNNYGTAPGFILAVGGKYIICLQGVPNEMEHLFIEDVLPFLVNNIPPSHQMVTRVLHTIGIGESVLDSLIGDFERMDNPTVGLLAHSGTVDIRLVASADTPIAASRMIAEVEEKIRTFVPEYIYGSDEEDIMGVISQLALLAKTNYSVTLNQFPEDFTYQIPNLSIRWNIPMEIPDTNSNSQLSFIYQDIKQKNEKRIVIKSTGQCKIVRTYAGSGVAFQSWAKNTISYYIWRNLLNLQENG